MGQAATQAKTTFTGTLLQRDHLPGERFMKLVFREADKDWLCISSNLLNARLEVGKQYHIRGMLRSLGERTYVHEPKIMLVGSRVATFRRLGFGLGIVLLVATLTAMAVRLVHGNLAPTSAETLANLPKPAPQTTEPQIETALPPAETPAPDPTPAPSTPVRTTRRAVTTSTVVTPPTPTPQPNPGVGTPPAEPAPQQPTPPIVEEPVNPPVEQPAPEQPQDPPTEEPQT